MINIEICLKRTIFNDDLMNVCVVDYERLGCMLESNFIRDEREKKNDILLIYIIPFIAYSMLKK